MKCCGVLEPNEYLAPPNSNGSYPRSCCVQEKHTITNCTDDNVYKIGCYSKLMFNFQAKNQLVVWSSIVFNVFTVRGEKMNSITKLNLPDSNGRGSFRQAFRVARIMCAHERNNKTGSKTRRFNVIVLFLFFFCGF